MALKFEKAAQIEVSTAEFVPYERLIGHHMVKLHNGDLCSTLRLQGVPHESADIVSINGWDNQLCGLLRNLNSPHIALHTHIVRREVDVYPGGEFSNPFCKAFNDKYQAYIKRGTMYVNELYLSVVFRPVPTIKTKVLGGFSESEAVELLNDAVQACQTTLASFSPELLGIYMHNGRHFTELLEFYRYLSSGVWTRFGLPYADIAKTLPFARADFGKGGTGALKGPTSTVYFAMLGVNEYPHPTFPGILNGMLKQPCELIVSQVFTFIPKATALLQMLWHGDRLVSSKDPSEEQIAQIKEARGRLAANEFSFGGHSINIMVKADNLPQLTKNINTVGSELSDCEIKWVREDLAAEAVFWAQLPGNFRYRANIQPISSLNFADFNAFHSFPAGRIDGNQWGPAIMMLRREDGGPFFLSLHGQRATDPNAMQAASTLVVGKTGTGKTVLFGLLLAQMQKFRDADHPMTCVVFDRALGSGPMARVLRGNYYPLKMGVPSGFNPMQLANTPLNLQFLERLVRELVRHPSYPLTPKEDRVIHEAIKGVLAVPRELRRLSAVQEFLEGSDSSENGIARRLSKWCGNGPNAWLFDNAVDTLDVDRPIVGFDVTEFMESGVEEIKTVTMMYLMQRIKELMDGRRLPILMSEFGILLSGEAEDGSAIFGEFVEKGITQNRKSNSFIIAECQDFQQIKNNKTAYALLNQTSTKIFLPSDTANEADYLKYGDLTHREYQLIKNMGENSRKVLIKQGGRGSVVVSLNLEGFEDELAILSGNVVTSPLCESLVAELGDDPEVWLPEFHKQRLIR